MIRRLRLRASLLVALAVPGAAAAACSDLPAAPLDAEDGSTPESGTDGAAGDATGPMDGASDVRADGDAGSCAFSAPDASTLPVTGCSAKFGNGVDGVAAIGVAVDPQGSILVTGSMLGTNDFGGGALSSAGGQDIFITKLDSACKHVWSQRFGDADEQAGVFVKANAAGEIYVVSVFRGSVDFGKGPLTSTEYNVVLTKFDSCGHTLWAKKLGVSGRVDPGTLALDSQSNIHIGGAFHGAIDLGGGVRNGIPTGGSGGDIFFAKLDPEGKHLWSQVLTRLGDGGGTGGATSTASAPDGTIYVAGVSDNQAGQSIDFGAGPIAFTGPTAGWIARFTTTGTAISTSKFESATVPVKATKTGRVFAAGAIEDFTDLGTGPLLVDGPNGPTSPTTYIAEFSPSGSGATWVRAFGTKSPARVVRFSAFAVSETNIGVVGRCAAGIDLGNGTPCSSSYTFFARYDLSGNFVSASQHPSAQYGAHIALAPTNQFVVAGFEGLPAEANRSTVTKFAP